MLPKIKYTYGNIVATLAMIETPTATAIKIDAPDNDQSPLLSQEQKESEKQSVVEPELLIIRQKPITAKILTTMRHLRAQAGPWSRFRGLQVVVVYDCVQELLFYFLSNIVRGAFATSLVSIAISVVLCRLQMTWTHVVISASTTQPWYRRIPSVKSGKNIILPTVVWAVAQQVFLFVPMELFKDFGLLPYAQDHTLLGKAPNDVQHEMILKFIIVMLVMFSIAFLILLPATITLRRVQASMLPEENDPIVPFDRTFGGRVQPEVVGGSGAVSMFDAWTTFDSAARIRFVKLCAKIWIIMITTTVLYSMIMVAELKLVLGDKFKFVL